MMLKASVFKTWLSVQPTELEATTWLEYAQELFGNKHTEHNGDKRETKAFSPVSYLSQAQRGKDNVDLVYALVVDYDSLPEAHFAEILTWLQDNGMAYATYSTYSHKYKADDTVCCRLVMPLEQPIKAEDWPLAWFLLTGSLPYQGDHACKDASRLYGLPFVPAKRIEHAFIEIVDGKTTPVPDLTQVRTTEKLKVITEIRVFNRDKELTAYTRALGRTVKDKWRATMFRALRDKEAFANEDQGRHETLRQLCADVAANWPHIAVDVLAEEIFLPSLQEMAKTQSGLENLDLRLRDIERLILGSKEYYAKNTLGVDVSFEQKFGLKTHRTYDDTTPYTDVEIAQIAKEQGAPDDLSLEAQCAWLKQRWIVSNRGTYWILQLGGYTPGYAQSDITAIIRRRLAPAQVAGVELFTENAKGDLKPKTLSGLCGEYSTPANSLRASFSVQHSKLTISPSGKSTLVERAGTVRTDITPEFNPAVDGWLHALFGKEHVERGLDWLACATKLTEPIAALYISGPSGIGKNLLVLALARLFHDGAPCDMRSLVGRSIYNFQLLECPVIVADETMPEEATFEGVCEMIGTTARPLRRKFADEGTLLGATRVLLTANKDSMMSFKQAYTRDQIEAVAKRVLHIEADGAAVEYLREHPEHLDWATGKGNEVTKHILWLCENRVVVRKPLARFLVEGDVSRMSRMLVARNPLFSKILQWLAKYIRNPSVVERAYPQNIDKNGMYVSMDSERGALMWCNPYIIQAAWSPYLDASGRGAPDIETISSALTALCPYGMQADTERGLWPVEIEHVSLWATKNGFPTEGKINALLKRVSTSSNNRCTIKQSEAVN